MADQNQERDKRFAHRYTNPDGTPLSEEEKRRVDEVWASRNNSPAWANFDPKNWDGDPKKKSPLSECTQTLPRLPGKTWQPFAFSAV